MRYRHILLLMLPVILFFQCASRKKGHKEKKEEYNIPDNIPVEMRQGFVDNLEKGRVLYKENCSGCHGIFTQGKDSVPNFSQQQIDKYSSRYIMRDPSNHAVAFKMNPEDLNTVIMYLRCRVTDGSKGKIINAATFK
jgi:Cytochrome c